MEDLASMCERQCRKACNLRSAAEELEETGSNRRARRYRKRGSPKPAAEARAMETDPSPVRLWSADSEGHSDGYRTAFPSESEEMVIPPTRAQIAPEPSLEHDAKGLERPFQSQNGACGPAHGANAGWHGRHTHGAGVRGAGNRGMRWIRWKAH